MDMFFNPLEGVLKGKGGSLPHWRQERVLYFVTFRLADSLPREKLVRLREEKAAWISSHPEPLSSEEKAVFHERFRERVDRWLDAGHGSMILKNEEVRGLVAQAIRFFAHERYDLDLFVVAANHVHVLVAPMEGYALSDILKSWKSFSAREIRKLPLFERTDSVSIVWQKESWDHIVRSPASLARFRDYIRSHREYRDELS